MLSLSQISNVEVKRFWREKQKSLQRRLTRMRTRWRKWTEKIVTPDCGDLIVLVLQYCSPMLGMSLNKQGPKSNLQDKIVRMSRISSLSILAHLIFFIHWFTENTEGRGTKPVHNAMMTKDLRHIVISNHKCRTGSFSLQEHYINLSFKSFYPSIHEQIPTQSSSPNIAHGPWYSR